MAPVESRGKVKISGRRPLVCGVIDLPYLARDRLPVSNTNLSYPRRAVINFVNNVWISF